MTRSLLLVIALAGCASAPGALDPSADPDGDGLTTAEEQEGWVVSVNATGWPDDAQSLLVVSDPRVADTDGDGLDDGEERLERSDPTLADSDGDGLSDLDEVVRWGTSPTHVDSDGDSFGGDPEAPRPPLAYLFDGAELRLREVDGALLPGIGATAPDIADTDGDGRSDYDEILSSSLDPAIADLPDLVVGITRGSRLDLSLDVTYTDGTMETDSASSGLGLTESTSHTVGSIVSSSVYSEISNTTSVDVELSVGCCASIVSEDVTIRNETAFTLKLNSSFTAETDTESSRTSHESWSRLDQQTRTRSHDVTGARVQALIDLSNPSDRTFTVRNLSVSVFADDGYVLRPVASLRPLEGTTYTLAPGETLEGLVLTDDEADPARVSRLMADPRRVILAPGTFGMVDAQGIDYAFQQDLVMERATRLSIDWESHVDELHLATNVDRDETGARRGSTVADALRLAGVDYTVEDVDGAMYYALDDRRTEKHEGPAPDFDRFEDPAYERSGGPGPRVTRASWHVFFSRADGSDPAEESYTDWGQARLQPGDQALLVYSADRDRDGLVDREEALHGSSDNEIDTDGDGLTDFWEIKEGWLVETDTIAPYHTFSSPSQVDRDGDGLDDVAEQQLGTDPNRIDTDGDGFTDAAEVEVGQDPLRHDAPSLLEVCCRVAPDGFSYDVLVYDDDADAESVLVYPGHGGAPYGESFDVHGADSVARIPIPTPLYWRPEVEVRDALGQRVLATCPMPGTDGDDAFGCGDLPADVASRL